MFRLTALHDGHLVTSKPERLGAMWGQSLLGKGF